MTMYPQAKPFKNDEIELFLSQPLIAKFCTHNRDGSIHIAPLWFRYQNGEILLGTQEVTRKVANVKRKREATLLIDTHEPALQAVIMQGQATLDYEDVMQKRTAIFEKYMGAEEAPGLANQIAVVWQPVIIRVKPKHITSFDYSKGFGVGADSAAAEMRIVS